MIIWCSYCQAFIGESRPYDDPCFTHGICERCYKRDDVADGLIERTASVRELFGRLLAGARAADARACAELLGRARRIGLSGDAVVVGLLQPALYQAGLDWQDGKMTVAEEHRLTDWCERAFHLLADEAPPATAVDVLIFQTPGNRHTVGPRFAAHVLRARGLATEAYVPELPFDEMLGLVRAARPRIVGLSCALAASVAVAVELAQSLRAQLGPTLQPRFVLSGMAFRFCGGDAGFEPPQGIEVVRSLDELFAPAQVSEVGSEDEV